MKSYRFRFQSISVAIKCNFQVVEHDNPENVRSKGLDVPIISVVDQSKLNFFECEHEYGAKGYARSKRFNSEDLEVDSSNDCLAVRRNITPKFLTNTRNEMVELGEIPKLEIEECA